MVGGTTAILAEVTGRQDQVGLHGLHLPHQFLQVLVWVDTTVLLVGICRKVAICNLDDEHVSCHVDDRSFDGSIQLECQHIPFPDTQLPGHTRVEFQDIHRWPLAGIRRTTPDLARWCIGGNTDHS